MPNQVVTLKVSISKQCGQLSGIIKCNGKIAYTDNEAAPCIDRAKNLNIPIHINKPKDFSISKSLYEQTHLNYYPGGSSVDEASWLALRLVG